MTLFEDYEDATAEELANAIEAFIPNGTFSGDFEKTPERLNWMLAVYAIDFGYAQTPQDLRNLLAVMNAHYAGPISIHEDGGGCNANSNQELITSKIEFDLSEHAGEYNQDATLSAVELGWVDFSYVTEAAMSELDHLSIRSEDFSDDSDCLEMNYCDWLDNVPACLSIYAYGRGEKRYVYTEYVQVEMYRQKWIELRGMIMSIKDPQTQARFTRLWLINNDTPLAPYNPHA